MAHAQSRKANQWRHGQPGRDSCNGRISIRIGLLQSLQTRKRCRAWILSPPGSAPLITSAGGEQDADWAAIQLITWNSSSDAVPMFLYAAQRDDCRNHRNTATDLRLEFCYVPLSP